MYQGSQRRLYALQTEHRLDEPTPFLQRERFNLPPMAMAACRQFPQGISLPLVEEEVEVSPDVGLDRDLERLRVK